MEDLHKWRKVSSGFRADWWQCGKGHNGDKNEVRVRVIPEEEEEEKDLVAEMDQTQWLKW